MHLKAHGPWMCHTSLPWLSCFGQDPRGWLWPMQLWHYWSAWVLVMPASWHRSGFLGENFNVKRLTLNWCLMFDVWWCLRPYTLWYSLWICQAINWAGWLVTFCVKWSSGEIWDDICEARSRMFLNLYVISWLISGLPVCPDLFLWSAWNLPRQEGAGTTAACECWGVFEVESVNWKWTVQLWVRKVNLMYVDKWILFSPYFVAC